VEEGEFPSIEAAVRQILDDRMAGEGEYDLDWAKPLIDEALAEVERGEVLSPEEFRARNAARRARRKA
jgi:antitoxin ParD1/3/4